MPNFRVLPVLVFTAALHVFAPITLAQDEQQDALSAEIRPDDSTGRQKYLRYCAVCHGQDGDGYGPMAEVLKEKPADLTRISARNGGEFPFERVADTIANGGGYKAHGSSSMLAWGPVFSSEANAQRAAARIEQLADYLRTIQIQ